MNVGGESGVKGKDVGPVVEVGDYGDFLLQGAVADDGIIDGYAGEIVVDFVGQVDEGIGYVRDVIARVTFASQVDFALLQTESSDKTFIEASKFFAESDFVCDVWCPLGKAHADGLLDP